MELRILEQIQTWRTPFLDNFFKYFTFLGDGGWCIGHENRQTQSAQRE